MACRKLRGAMKRGEEEGGLREVTRRKVACRKLRGGKWPVGSYEEESGL